MSNMFIDCAKITDYTNILKNFNTEKVKTMDYMFARNHSLKTLNLNHFKVPSLTSMQYMMYDLDNLEDFE